MPFLDTKRFDRLSEDEVLQRIGALLATALARCGQSRVETSAMSAPLAKKAPTPDDPARFVGDSLERQLVRYLAQAGPASPRELSAALGLARRTVTRKLARLRATGLCEAVGKTRNTRYQLRRDFGRN